MKEFISTKDRLIQTNFAIAIYYNILNTMKRPSNLIIGFILILATAFIAYGMARIFMVILSSPEVEFPQDN